MLKLIQLGHPVSIIFKVSANLNGPNRGSNYFYATLVVGEESQRLVSDEDLYSYF